MFAIRRRLRAEFQQPIRIRLRTESTLVIDRGAVTIIANLGGESMSYAMKPSATVEFVSTRGAAELADGIVTVQPESTVVVLRSDA